MLRLILLLLTLYLIYEFLIRPQIAPRKSQTNSNPSNLRRINDTENAFRRRDAARNSDDTEEAEYEEIK